MLSVKLQGCCSNYKYVGAFMCITVLETSVKNTQESVNYVTIMKQRDQINFIHRHTQQFFVYI